MQVFRLQRTASAKATGNVLKALDCKHFSYIDNFINLKCTKVQKAHFGKAA